MATVMGGVGYGLYFVAKVLTEPIWKNNFVLILLQRYVYPMIAPPTAPQLEQDKKAIDESFEKAFSLLDQLAKDTEILKSSEQARTERLDTALGEVENVISELKISSRRREEESRRISDEVRGLRDLIPKAMEGQKENTDSRLKELNTELKSLKTLMGQRMNPTTQTSTNSYGRPSGSVGASTSAGTTSGTTNFSNANQSSSTEGVSPKPASVSNGMGTESVASIQGRTASPFNTGAPAGRAAIPAWQMAAANKSSTSVNTTGTGGSGSQDASGAA
jgi:peroxin-14